jgi:hypothetical protein
VINSFELISKVKVSVDRIDTSIPRQYKNKLYQVLNSYNNKRYTKRFNKYIYHGFKIDNCRVILSYPIKPKLKYSNKNRCYIRLLQPTTDCQNTIKNSFEFVVGRKYDRNGVILKQIEIAYDIYAKDDDYYSCIESFLDHHCIFKYGKRRSYNQFKQTKYMGNNGNANKGTIGVRRYRKTISGRDVYRFEIQFNRRYLKDNNITFNLFPIDPQSFYSLNHIEILDNYSELGITKLSEKILKEEGLNKNNTKSYFNKLKEHKAAVKKQIVSGSSGPKKRIFNQIDALNTLLKEKGLSTHYKNYFEPVPHFKHILYCLSDIDIIENNVSKRICFCRT